MKKLILITIFLMSAMLSFRQKKKPVFRANVSETWVEGGGMNCINCPKTDTVIKTYYLQGKDSTSVEVKSENCKCKFYVESGETQHRSCKGLKRFYLYSKYWNLYMDITSVKGKVLKISKTHWESFTAQFSFVDGTFIQNNRSVYPSYIFLDKLYKTNLN